MTPKQIQIVRDTWQQVMPTAATAAGLFYDRLFETEPGLRRLFARTDMAAQHGKLLQVLDVAVAGLERPESVLPVLQNLGRRHAGYGITTGHFDAVGAAFLWTLEQGLGEVWTPAAEDAWTEAYGMVAAAMCQGLAEVQPVAVRA